MTTVLALPDADPALDPPWWLTFETPEMWKPSVEEWSEAYEHQLEVWLKAMKDQEKGAAFLEDVPLSEHMRESWRSGHFWLNYAARQSWTFDAVYWNFLHERLFGAREPEIPNEELWRTRLDPLSAEEQQAMEPLTSQKTGESLDPCWRDGSLPKRHAN